MSKTSSKQRYEQLKDWLNSRGTSTKSRKQPAEKSRLDHYQDKLVK